MTIMMLGLVLFSPGCHEVDHGEKTGNGLSAVDSLRNVVMDLHNEEMGKMGQMMKQERQLKELIAEIDSATQPAAYEALSLGIMTLDSGSFSMKSWMRNWAEPDSTAAVEDQMKGLEYQQAFMEETSALMRKGIDMAAKLIKEYGADE